MSQSQQWDARGYDDRFSYVTSYGADLLELLDIQPGERVLDLGCGTGHQAAALAALGAHVVGIDSDTAMLDVAQAEHPELTLLRRDAQALDAAELVDAAGGPYDAVVSNAAMHWMPRQDDVVAGVAALLRPGGRFVVEMGGHGNVARLIAAIRSAQAAVALASDVTTPWTFPSPAEQASRLERYGFTVRLVQLFDRMTPLTGADTAADWVRMFGAGMVEDVPADRRAEFDGVVDAAGVSLGLDHRPDGAPGWWADYVRLRFLAELAPAPG
ncbi:MAG TPA: methyltransferase domain-containing protein [Candidatus Nanopelagicales bacterium]|jgi:trans-aconitate methyltransferase